MSIVIANVINYTDLTKKVFYASTGKELKTPVDDNLHFYSYMESKYNSSLPGSFEPPVIIWAIYDKKSRVIVECGKTVAASQLDYYNMRGNSQRGRKYAKYYSCKKVADNKKPLIGGEPEIRESLNNYLTRKN